MKIVVQYHDYSKKNERGAFGKLINKSFCGQTPARVTRAKVLWEKKHLHCKYVSSKLAV